MLYVGLDLRRKRLDWHARQRDDPLVGTGTAVPDADGRARLVHQVGYEPVLAVIESMTGARFVHDQVDFGRPSPTASAAGIQTSLSSPGS